MYYKQILDRLPLMIYVKHDNDLLTPVFYNKAWYDYTGVTPEEVADGWDEVVHPQDVARLKFEITAHALDRTEYTVEVRILSKKNWII